jgi:hypothetical protein
VKAGNIKDYHVIEEHAGFASRLITQPDLHIIDNLPSGNTGGLGCLLHELSKL